MSPLTSCVALLNVMYRPCSVDIYKVWVLLICHVSEGCIVKIAVLHPPVCPQLCTLPLFSSVFALKSETKDKEEDNLSNVGNKQRTDAQGVIWGLLGSIKKGRGNIADTCSKPDHARNNHLLRLPARVRGDQ